MIKQILLFRLGSSRVVPRDSLGGKPNPTGMTSGVSKERHLTLLRLDLSSRRFRGHGIFTSGNQVFSHVGPGDSIGAQIEVKSRN
jgi:hypothetical protein